jgi:hypothetical protein
VLWGDASADDTVTAATLGGSTVNTTINKLCQFDPDLSGSAVAVYTVQGSAMAGNWGQFNRNNLISLQLTTMGGVTGVGDSGDSHLVSAEGTDYIHVRRLNTIVGRDASNATAGVNALGHDEAGTSLLVVLAATGSFAGATQAASVFGDEGLHSSITGSAFKYAIDDNFGGTAAARSGDALGAVVGTGLFDLENESVIPEIDIKVDSISVTAVTKKLKAKWTPELGQDLNAYHNLDAEVELDLDPLRADCS